ncbi:retrovirus-related pol polyprotein from transposon TNT 1-94 [Tanacetum coccineum]
MIVSSSILLKSTKGSSFTCSKTSTYRGRERASASNLDESNKESSNHSTMEKAAVFNCVRELVGQAWEKHSHDHFRSPTAHDIEILIKTCLMPLALKTQNDSFTFVHELKQEMHADLKVYYVKGLNHNLFSVGQFCDADLEVAFRKSTCFVRDLQGNDLLTGNRGSDLYTISLQETTSSTPLCLMAKASPTQAWLWHRRLSHLNFDYINLLLKKDVVIGLPKLKYVKDKLCSSCEVSKAKKKLIQDKDCSKFKEGCRDWFTNAGC